MTKYKYTVKKTNFREITKNSNNILNVDTELLKTLFKINSPSYKEGDMIKFIFNYVKKNLTGVSIKKDKYNNLYLTKGVLNGNENYPCLIAHMDEVHEVNKNKKIVEVDNFIFGFDPVYGERVGIGSDDKNGIYVALTLLKYIPKLKVIFTTGEEVGLVGASKVDLTFFNNVGYLMQCDRRGHTDLITRTNGIDVSSDDFIYDTFGICDEYGYSENTGTCTDVGEIISRGVAVSGCNISCGYWDEHTDDEFCYVPALENCLNLVYLIICELGTKKYELKLKPVKKSYYNQYESWWDDPCLECTTGDCFNCKKRDLLF